MSNELKVKNATRKAKLDSDVKLFEQSIVLVPYLASGYIDYTNKGAVSTQQNIYDHETFKRVWSGNDAFILTWKDSVTFVQDTNTKIVETRYSLGEVILGQIIGDDNYGEVNNDESFSDYKSQQVKGNLRLRVNANTFRMDDNYLLYFYKIPELSGSQLYRIMNLTKSYLGKDEVSYIVELATINQEFSSTGKAKQQNVMPSAPGQGYLECIVYNEGEIDLTGLEEGIDYYKLYDRIITADKNKTLNFNPVKKVVVKAFGACIFSNISFEVRRVEQGKSFTQFGEPRQAFPINLAPATTPTLFRSQQPESNFYWGNFTPTLKFWKDLMATIKDSLTPVNQWDFQGFLVFRQRELDKSNALVNVSTYSIYNNQLFGFSKVDPITGEPVFTPWKFNLGVDKTYDTSLNYGCEPTYKIKNEEIAIHDRMFHSYWIQKKYRTLPMSAESCLGFGSLLGFAIGAAVTKGWKQAVVLATIGIVASLAQNLFRIPMEGFLGFIPTALVDMNKDQFPTGGVDNVDKIPFNTINSTSSESPSNAFFSGSTMTTAFTADLTDEFISSRLPAKFLNTSNIGQDKYVDGTYILPSREPFLLNGDTTLIEMSPQYGFIVDSFNIQALFDGEYSVEFLDVNDNVIWSGIYQSEAKFTKSLREINTWKNTSIFGRENMFIGEPIPYPLAPPAPTGLSPDLSEIEKSISIRTTIQNVYNENKKRRLDALAELEINKPNYFDRDFGIYSGNLIFQTIDVRKGRLNPETENYNLLFKYNKIIKDWETFKYYFPTCLFTCYAEVSDNLSGATNTNSYTYKFNMDDSIKNKEIEAEKFRATYSFNKGDFAEYRFTNRNNMYSNEIFLQVTPRVGEGVFFRIVSSQKEYGRGNYFNWKETFNNQFVFNAWEYNKNFVSQAIDRFTIKVIPRK